MRLYQMQDSGNCYKVRLLAHKLGLPLELVDIDILKGESRTEDFLARNPNGRVPALELEDGTTLAESNAIMFYLAEGTPFLPQDRRARARALQWMFFEQYSHEPYIAVARFWWTIKPGGREERKDRFAEWHERGYQALAVMERHLARHDWFAGNACSIADFALYAYTHVAHEGAFDLAPYKAIGRWMDRIRNAPDHIPMEWRSSV
ncbi:Glutathione S-transferase domain [Parvibaculum lavamentivorans DS-1]|uniref:Glutathione S-transferase domain n=1 Tax=Parvibaculum lavamentivorans (strain DS-1 / DSM 13023 / NCIMB 13966) TaxID=402881 RepID=A7HVH7_PARL1|nr:glutathione S-transferase family protein [Parvibaculum lavamentivorans]ABS63910.1 Glutathione S-transferase domain [Parvibaculum lavamentivorans DS-1]